MVEKRQENLLFEAIAIMGIVAIVAITGHFLTQSNAGGFGGGDAMTGNVVAEGLDEPVSQTEVLTDVSIEGIALNPESPVISEPFDIVITLENRGNADIKTPFFVTVEVLPTGYSDPLVLTTTMTKILAVGERADVSFNVMLVPKEGPIKITAKADVTGKLGDYNQANNLWTKTEIISIA